MLAGVVTCRWSARCHPGTTIEKKQKQKQISRHCESEPKPSLAKGYQRAREIQSEMQQDEISCVKSVGFVMSQDLPPHKCFHKLAH